MSGLLSSGWATAIVLNRDACPLASFLIGKELKPAPPVSPDDFLSGTGAPWTRIELQARRRISPARSKAPPAVSPMTQRVRQRVGPAKRQARRRISTARPRTRRVTL